MKRINIFKKERYIGDSDVIKSRYGRIYGYGEYEKKTAELIERNTNRYYIYLSIIILLLTMVFIKQTDTTSGILTDKDGYGKYLVNNAKGEVYRLQVYVGEKDNRTVENVEIRFLDKDETISQNDGAVHQKTVSESIDEIVREISGSKNTKIKLPEKLNDGTGIKWKEAKTNYILPALIGVAIMGYALYRSRYSEIDREEKEAARSVTDLLPGFVVKLTLLLNAGMIFQGAFEKIARDSKNISENKDSYFYSQLRIISDNVKNNNLVVHKELEKFAERIRIKEFTRIVGIISDNINKGIILTDKLEKEGDELWFNQKKYIEEKGRLAETKLVAPLALLLLMLVLITVAPAIIEM